MSAARPSGRFVALLRAVNVAGRAVPMAGLRELATELGFQGARTLLQSGNLVFAAAHATPEEIEGRLERAIAERFGLETDVLVRSADEWADVIARNPFAAAADRDPAHLLAYPLKAAPSAEAAASLAAAIAGRETTAVLDRTLYAVYPDGVGNSKLTIALIERRLGTRGTGRNWNTVRKLAEASVVR